MKRAPPARAGPNEWKLPALRAANTERECFDLYPITKEGNAARAAVHGIYRVATIVVDHCSRLHLTVGKEPGVGEGITNGLSELGG